MSLNKVTYTDHQTVISAENLNDIQDEIISTSEFVECSTAAGTAAKTATLNNFVLSTGACVRIKFTYSNTSPNPTLNVNTTGAKPIKQYGTTAVGTTEATSWKAGAVVTFTYDGTNWVMADNNSDSFVPKSNTGIVSITDKFTYNLNSGYSLVRAFYDKTNNTVRGSMYCMGAPAFSNATAVFTVDSAYRPDGNYGFPAMIKSNGAWSAYMCTIKSDGYVKAELSSTATMTDFYFYFEYPLS